MMDVTKEDLIAVIEECVHALIELDHDLMEQALRSTGRILRKVKEVSNESNS
jgi:hypothetical protein